MTTLIIAQGIPASGKSTWVAEERKRRERSGNTVVVVSRDSIRYAMFGTYYPDFSAENFVTKVQDNAIQEGLMAGHTVIVDNMNLRAKYVRPIVNMGLEHNAVIIGKSFVDVPLKTCLSRNSKRDRVVDEDFIRKTHAKFVANNHIKIDTIIAEQRELNDQKYTADDSLPSAYIFDIDGTLAEKHDGRTYFEYDLVGGDHLIPEVADVAKSLKDSGYTILAVTGRENISRSEEETIKWLESHSIPFDSLHMRAGGDHRSDTIVKKEILQNELASKYNIRGVFDDRNSVVAMWRSLGLRVFQVAQGNF